MPLAATALLFIAIVMGGGGSPAPASEALVELASVIVLGVAIARGVRPTRVFWVDPAFGLLLVAVALFPLAQLLPLPPAVWRALPGREPMAAALDAIGAGTAWRPWSLLPDGGLAAALALLPAVALVLLVAARPPAVRVSLIGGFALAAAGSALLGLVQFGRGPDAPLALYGTAQAGFAVGFFANRAAQADLIAIALTAVVLLIDRHRHRIATVAGRAGVALAPMLLLIAGLATGSRMGIAMLLVPMALAAGLVARGRLLAGVGGGGLAAVMLLLAGSALDRVAARAHDPGNRVAIWRDAVVAARTVAPVGAGMGGFVPVYERTERLDEVQPTYANRAHNDWLELAIEGGVPALLLLGATLTWVARRSWRGWRDPDPDRRLLARFGGLTTLILALHASVDYPLRTLALLAVAGLAAGGLARGSGDVMDQRHAASA